MASRNLTLFSRRENTRESIGVQVFDINEIEKHLTENIEAVERKFSLADALNAEENSEEVKDILRTQIVFLESAFDFYMHEITKLCIINMFNGEWGRNIKTNKYKNLKIAMDYVEKAVMNTKNDEWLRDWINDTYNSITLMSYEKFKETCNLLGLDINAIAENVFNLQENANNKLKNFLSDLYNRRNLIAHQSDRKSENAVRQNISQEEVENYIRLMKKVVEAVNFEIKNKSN